MKRLYLFVEGPTEETFVRELLAPHYARKALFITPILFSTRPGYKGGVGNYEKVKPQLIRLCREDRKAHVSTMIDLYALRDNFPGKSDANYPLRGTGYQKAEFLEKRLAQDINEPNFIAHLTVHEFEAMLFVEPQRFADWVDDKEIIEALGAISSKYPTPEDINDNKETAPSKRIQNIVPGYQKTFHGPLIATETGLDKLRQKCPHFNTWLVQLERLAEKTPGVD